MRWPRRMGAGGITFMFLFNSERKAGGDALSVRDHGHPRGSYILCAVRRQSVEDHCPPPVGMARRAWWRPSRSRACRATRPPAPDYRVSYVWAGGPGASRNRAHQRMQRAVPDASRADGVISQAGHVISRRCAGSGPLRRARRSCGQGQTYWRQEHGRSRPTRCGQPQAAPHHLIAERL